MFFFVKWVQEPHRLHALSVSSKELSIEQMYAADLAIVKDRRLRSFKSGGNSGKPVVKTAEMVVVGQLRKH